MTTALPGYGAIPALTAAQIPGITLSTGTTRNRMNLPGITFKITQANGGTIVTVSEESTRRDNLIALESFQEELYIIPDGVEDFDRELGKIITMHRMKSQNE